MITVLCENPLCKKEFLTKHNLIAQGYGKYCSRQCYALCKNHKVAVQCANDACRKIFSVTESRLTSGHAKHCSKTCYYACKKGKPLSPIEKRFWPRVQICSHGTDCPYCCWPWIGTKFQQTGYGCFGIFQSDYTSHRIAWNIRNQQEMSTDLEAAHYCHNRPCCNPDHIHAATPKENREDSLRDGTVIWGSAHPLSKLTEASIPLIFSLYASGKTMDYIAHVFSVSLSNIAKILHRQSWDQVPIDIELLKITDTRLRRRSLSRICLPPLAASQT